MPTTYAYTAPAGHLFAKAERHAIPAGASVLLRPGTVPIGKAPKPATAWCLSVIPGAGGTALAEVSVSLPTDDPDAMHWHPLSAAPVSAATLYVFPGPVAAVRVSATTAAAVAELLA